MANEISITQRIVDAVFGVDLGSAIAISVDRAGDSFTMSRQSIGTSNELLSFHADIGTAGWLFIKNTDATNFVQIGTTDDTTYLIKLLAGESALFRAATKTIWAKADTAACVLEYCMLEL